MSEMEFGSTLEERRERSTKPRFRRTEFLKLEPGEYRIRLLEPRETMKYTHYIAWSYVECLGDECPVCENGKRILYEHPTDYRTVKGWNPRSQRFYINVFDKTITRTCPKCATEKDVDLCPACSSPMGERHPANKVKVLSMSSKLLEDIKVLSKSVRNREDERIDIRMYDFILEVRGRQKNKSISVAHRWYPGDEALEDIGEQELFDLEQATIKLNREEMLDMFNGASLKDIFAVRKAQREVVKDLPALSDQVQEDIKLAVDNLFGGED